MRKSITYGFTWVKHNRTEIVVLIMFVTQMYYLAGQCIFKYLENDQTLSPVPNNITFLYFAYVCSYCMFILSFSSTRWCRRHSLLSPRLTALTHFELSARTPLLLLDLITLTQLYHTTGSIRPPQNFLFDHSSLKVPLKFVWPQVALHKTCCVLCMGVLCPVSCLLSHERFCRAQRVTAPHSG